MRRTSHTNYPPSRALTVDTKGLQALLYCGRDTATKIGTDAHARIQMGKRVLWNVEKIQDYLNSVSSGGD